MASGGGEGWKREQRIHSAVHSSSCHCMCYVAAAVCRDRRLCWATAWLRCAGMGVSSDATVAVSTRHTSAPLDGSSGSHTTNAFTTAGSARHTLC